MKTFIAIGCIVLVLCVPLGNGLHGQAQLTTEVLFIEIGKLHMQVSALREYAASLQADAVRLQEENAKLKSTPLPCKDKP